MSRAIWKGSITFGLVSIPVALHTATQSKGHLSFHLYDKRDMARVGNKRVNKETGEEVESADIVKGIEEEGRVVVLSDEELDAAKAERDQLVEISEFVEKDHIPIFYYDRPYFLEPQKGGVKGYALLREALKRTEKVGLAKVVVSTRQHLAALYPEGDLLLVELLRWPDELKDPADMNVPGDLKSAKVSDKEVDLAVRLVEDMVEEFDPTKYRDESEEQLRAVIAEKLETGEVKLPKHPAKPAAPEGVVDIVSLLRKSIEDRGGAEGGARRTRAPKRAQPARSRSRSKKGSA